MSAENQYLSYREQDKLIRLLALLPEGEYNVKPSQVPLIKLVWEALHHYDKNHEYTMSSDWKKIRKFRRYE